MSNRDVVVIIPARLGSTRLPRKALAPLGGKPLIEHVWKRVRRCRFVHGVFVATDSEEIATVVRGFGGAPVMTSTKCPSGTDRVAEALRQVGAWAAINVQGDEPFISPQAVDRVAKELHETGGRAVVTLARPGDDTARLRSPHVVKVVLSGEGNALYFSRASVPFSKDSRGEFLEHIGVYGYTATLLKKFVGWGPSKLEQAERLEQLRFLEHGVPIRVLTTEYKSFGIDTPEDLRRAEKQLRRGKRAWSNRKSSTSSSRVA
jgi:3-deoxy-manno-octulosonate cytidylyltransferase (CMP-KDO synthetase)